IPARPCEGTPAPARGAVRAEWRVASYAPHDPVVANLSLQQADLAGESAGLHDHVLGDGRVVERSIAFDLVRDETRLLGGEETLSGLGGELRVRSERALRFYDGPDGRGGDFRMLLHESLGSDERREGPMARVGRSVAPSHVEQNFGDAALYTQVRPKAVAPV